jgi:hypothetical protein
MESGLFAQQLKAEEETENVASARPTLSEQLK